MKYFETGCKGGCYHQFVKGKWDGKTFWSDYFLILDDDILNSLNLYGLFAPIVPAYNPYGPTEFTVEQWDAIRKRAAGIGGELQLLIQELDDWLDASSDHGIAFTILGV